MDRYKTRMTGENYQLIVQAVNDRITGVSSLDQRINFNAIIPQELPGLDAIIERHTHRTIAEVENRTKLDLYPRRKTNYAKTPEQVYNNREYYYTTKQSFKNQNFLDFPHWAELTVEQQLEYNSDPLLYIDGSLVWDELTNEQKTLFSRNVFFIPNKSFDEEALDGKNRRYVDLLKNRVIKIHKLYLEIPNPGRLATVPFIYREYNPNEYFVYNEEGGVTLFPAVAMIEAINASPMYYGAGHGGAVPALPQVLHIDYTYGIEEIPEDLIDAIALLTAVKVFETVNICYTQGLLSFSVQGFSAAFGDGLYVKIMERFRDMAENTLIAHTVSSFRGGW